MEDAIARRIRDSTRKRCKQIAIEDLKPANWTRKGLPSNPQQDQWDFETVKGHPTIAARKNNTGKRRKLSVVHANSQGIPDLKQLDLKDSPLEFSSPSSAVTVKKNTVRKQPSVLPTDPPTKPRQASIQKRPLQPDTSFGNATSTVRLFSRVSDNSVSPTSSDAPSSRDENRPPLMEPNTKEALFGHRVHSKVVDPVFQKLHAQTSNLAKREALSNLADAWSALDAVDPEGEYYLMKLLIEKVQQEPKLASMLCPSKPPSRDGTPQASPQKAETKMIVANPQLRSHRRGQSSTAQEGEPKEKLYNLPGQIVPGMEHTKQLADVLYGQWAEGLKSRWPAV